MRLTLFASLALAALAALTGPAAPAAAQSAPAATPCEPRLAHLGGVGRAIVAAFTGPVFGARVCATVANLSFDGYTARVGDAPAAGALVAAALGDGGSITVPLEGTSVTGVGPYVVAPGGVMPSFGGDIAEEPRVVLAFSGQQVLVIGTTPVALVDLARALRLHPDVFGADAIERAVVLSSGANAALVVTTADGVLGAPSISAPRILSLMKRG